MAHPEDLGPMLAARLADIRRRPLATLESLGPEELAWHPNRESNSITNLVPHVRGFVEQRRVAGPAGEPSRLVRATEFAVDPVVPRDELAALIERCLGAAERRLATLAPEEWAPRSPGGQ